MHSLLGHQGGSETETMLFYPLGKSPELICTLWRSQKSFLLGMEPRLLGYTVHSLVIVQAVLLALLILNLF